MVIAEPSAELLALITAGGDPAPSDASAEAVRTATLLRRRFGLSLPLPLVALPGHEEPVRVAAAVDGPAIAAVKWRVFGTNYRGILDDGFLDRRDVVPPSSFWVGRAMLPPSRNHRLFVWGRPGVVYGYADCGPVHPEDAAPDRPDAGEVYEIYVDPVAQGHGGGRRLLAAAESWFAERSFAAMELSVLAGNEVAQAFYRAAGWEQTGVAKPVDLGVVAFEELRLTKPIHP